MKRAAIILSMFMVSGPLSVYGNGGGVYAISSAARSSDPIFREIRDITLLSEKLTIDIGSGYSEVTVKYVLWNGSDNDYNDIDYAFPVDYVSMEDIYDKAPVEPVVKKISFFCNDERLDFARSEDKLLTEAENDLLRHTGRSSYEEAYYNSLFRRWYYTKFSVKKHSLVFIEVQYTLSNLLYCDGNHIENLSPQSGCSVRSLVYDFSPAACWGDGVIHDFYVEVNVRNLLSAGGRSGDSIHTDDGSYIGGEEGIVWGLDFKRQGDSFVYSARNFDLKKVKYPLYINYSGAGEDSSMETLYRYMLAPQEYSTRASRDSPGYGRTNLGDMNLETTWVGKTGDWIDISLNDAGNTIWGISIVNGYRKSAETYEQNNRVKTMKIELKGKEGEFYDIGFPLTFEDEPYQHLFFENLFKGCIYFDFAAVGPIDGGFIGQIRLTIQEVYPGTKYDDTCISEIILLGGDRLHPVWADEKYY